MRSFLLIRHLSQTPNNLKLDGLFGFLLLLAVVSRAVNSISIMKLLVLISIGADCSGLCL